jgi:hypothetical protein
MTALIFLVHPEPVPSPSDLELKVAESKGEHRDHSHRASHRNDKIGGGGSDSLWGEADNDVIYDGDGSSADGVYDYMDGGTNNAEGDTAATFDYPTPNDTRLNFEH